MKNHVTSLELAKQLKEAGYPQIHDCEFIWWKDPEKGITKWMLTMHADKFPQVTTPRTSDIVSAPLATELLEQIHLLPRTAPTKFYISMALDIFNVEDLIRGKFVQSHSLPDALAEMWLYIKKEELL